MSELTREARSMRRFKFFDGNLALRGRVWFDRLARNDNLGPYPICFCGNCVLRSFHCIFQSRPNCNPTYGMLLLFDAEDLVDFNWNTNTWDTRLGKKWGYFTVFYFILVYVYETNNSVDKMSELTEYLDRVVRRYKFFGGNLALRRLVWLDRIKRDEWVGFTVELIPACFCGNCVLRSFHNLLKDQMMCHETYDQLLLEEAGRLVRLNQVYSTWDTQLSNKKGISQFL